MKNALKKFIVYALTVATICAFASCGGNDGSGNSEENDDYGGSKVDWNATIKPRAGWSSNGETTVGNWYDDENFEPVIRFTVTADTHVGTGTTDFYYWTQDLFAEVFQHSYAYAETQEYNTLDVFVDVGDFTDHGLLGEYENFVRVYKDNIREETSFIPVMAGHELIKGSVNDFKTNLRVDTGIHEMINGYHLIAISNNNDTSPCNGFDWVSEQIKSAYEDDPTKPIFVFQHHPINDTIYTSNDNKYSEQYDAIYKNYPNVILFTAHTHCVGSDPSNILQRDYTMLGVASIAYHSAPSEQESAVEVLKNGLKTVDGVTGYTTYNVAIDEEYKGVGEFYIVEADAKGRTRILVYDVYQNGFKKDLYGEGTLAYYFEDVTDKSTWLYTTARYEEDSAPSFTAEAEITVLKNENGKFGFEFPQAQGKYGVYCYDMFLTNDETGETVSHRIYSMQWLSIMPQKRDYEFSGLTSGAEYTLSIEPVNSFAKYGEPLSLTFTAA